MADPLSLTASIIAIGGLVRTVTKGVERIIALKNAPALIINLSNEVRSLCRTPQEGVLKLGCYR